MYCKTHSATLRGIEANIIGVELDLSDGIPCFNIVGLADKSINESRERLTVALGASSFPAAPQRITINLTPGHIRKEGAHLDLAMAACLMLGNFYINAKPSFLENFAFFGELSLRGDLRPVLGILPLALRCQEQGIRYLVVPKANELEASLVKLSKNNKVKVFQVSNLHELKELIERLYQEDMAEEFSVQAPVIHNKKSFTEDLSEVIGQEHAKRGLEIAAAGRHHLLMLGPPGCGKSMLAKRFRTLLPSLNFDEALESTKIYSVCGLLNEKIIIDAPYRAPHHSASAVSLVGGGRNSKPGEISLAHNGVLFLDELTEFNKSTIEQLRQVLENKEITINRIQQSLSYPADFVLIAACNPCPCGYLGDEIKNCTCSPLQISNYINKLSGPLLDRIDMHLELSRLNQEEIKILNQRSSGELSLLEKTESSVIVYERVIAARKFAQSNKLSFEMSLDAQNLMEQAILSLDLSARSHQKIIKVARTIANLAQSKKIQAEHLAEAMQYRSLDWEKYRK